MSRNLNFLSLCENGVILMPFDLMVTSAFGSAATDSFGSKIITAVAQDICHSIANKTYMRSNPTRLVASTVPNFNETVFGKGAVGLVLADQLSQTMSMVTIEHMTAFVRLIDSGNVSALLREITKDFQDKFNRFQTLYKEQRPRLQRFRDESLSTPGTLVYDRFEGAYSFFTVDNQIQQVFKAMKSLGNILAIASMLDINYNEESSTCTNNRLL